MTRPTTDAIRRTRTLRPRATFSATPLAGLTGGFVVGAPGDDLSGSDGGAGYRFDLATGDCETIYEVSGLTDAALGTSIATDGTQVLIGAPDAKVSDQTVGKAFLFNLTGGTPTQNWTGPNLSDFGRSVALLGDNAYVGAPSEEIVSDLAGKVHVYNRTSGAPQTDLLNPARISGEAGDFGLAAAGGQVTHAYAIDPDDVTISVDLIDEDGTHYAVVEKDVRITLSLLTWDPDGVTDASFEGSGDWDDASAWLDMATSTRYQWDPQWATRPVEFIGNGGTVNVNANVTVENMDFEIGGYTLSGANTLTLTGGAITTGFLPVEISTPISGSAGLEKRGIGELILSGTNTLTGSTTVTEGELRVDGSLASSPVTVLDGVLSGTGAVGDLTIEYGLLEPGGSAIGTLSTGDLALSTRSTLEMYLGTSTNDLIDVTGTVDLGDAILSLAGMRSNLDSEVLVLIDNDGADAVAGTFSGLREGATVECGGVLYLVTYKYDADTATRDTGNDVALVDVVYLAAPASVSATLYQNNYNQILATWTDTATETNFEIERNWNGVGWEAVATVGQDVTSYVDTGLQEYSSYRYRVRALDDQNPDAVSEWTTLDLQSAVVTGISSAVGADYDNDGLDNTVEDTNGTDPLHFDTDGDGLPDGWEAANLFDPLDDDENNNDYSDYDDDADSDGLTNGQEYNRGTDPRVGDSDGDGVSDYVEAGQGSDPTDASDDGLAPPEDMISRHQLTVGDALYNEGHSPSEWWAIDVGDTRYVQPGYYMVGGDLYFFETGETYPITLEHLSTDPSFLEYNGPPGLMSPWYPQGAKYLPNYDWGSVGRARRASTIRCRISSRTFRRWHRRSGPSRPTSTSCSSNTIGVSSANPT